jgi:hypothetical protein
MPGIMIPSLPFTGAIWPAPGLLLSIGMCISPFRKGYVNLLSSRIGNGGAIIGLRMGLFARCAAI